MTFAKLVRSIALNVVLAPFSPMTAEKADAAPASPHLQIEPVTLVGYVGQALKVRVDLPCGSEFYGLVVSSPKAGRLEVAAAVLEDSIICTEMAQPREIVADYLATSGYKVIGEMAVDTQNPRLAIARVSDLRIRTDDNIRSQIDAVYQPRCGTPIGTLVRRASQSRLELAMVEKPSGRSAEECALKPQRRAINALRINRYELAPLPEKPTTLARAYYLRYAPIKSDSVKHGSARGLEVTYRRQCNEAPVGLVVSDGGRSGDGKSRATVGVLVARYYNFPCPLGRKARWEKLADRDVLIGKATEIALRSPASEHGVAPSLSLRTPTKLIVGVSGVGGGTAAGRQNRPGLTANFVPPCGQTQGLVYARDAFATLTIGILVDSGARDAAGCSARRSWRAPAAKGSPNAAGSIAGDPFEVSLYQPFVAARAGDDGVLPLRLKGEPSR